MITHRPAFSLLAGAAAGLAVGAASLLRGRLPGPGQVLRPAALATALVGSHIVMDPLPLPYDGTPIRSKRLAEVLAVQGWNAVIDMAVYGALAALVLQRNGASAGRSG
jgi:hypothetical protein